MNSWAQNDRLWNVRDGVLTPISRDFGSGLRILAAPVLDLDNYPVGAVSVAAPAVRMTSKEFRSRALEPMRRAVKDIARVIQASGTVSAIA